MRLLELFSGTGVISGAAREEGLETWTIDIDPFCKPDQVANIYRLEKKDIPEKYHNPEILWASPPCNTFSIMSCSKHWTKVNNMVVPKSIQAVVAQNVLQHTLELIEQLNPKYYFIENPRALMRKHWLMFPYERTTVTYCQYGYKVMKPTDIWTNSLKIWKPRKMCRNGDTCHESAPRGSSTGTRDAIDAMERGKVPPELIKEIIKAVREERTRQFVL